MKAYSVCFAILVGIAGCSSEPPPARSVPVPQVSHRPAPSVAKPELKLPENFDELVTQVQEYDEQVRAAINAGTLENARRALDEIGPVLERAVPLAKKYLPAERLKDVEQASGDLLAAFDAIHHSIDEKKKPDYSAQADKIEAAIEVLKVAGG